MTEAPTIDKTALTWAAPSKGLGALSGIVVVLGFTVVHNVFIADIWFNVGPMLFAGALCGFCIVWSYRKGVADHSTAAWFRYAGRVGERGLGPCRSQMGDLLIPGLASLAPTRAGRKQRHRTALGGSVPACPDQVGQLS